MVQSVIAATGSSRAAARILGISRDTLHKLRDDKPITFKQATKEKIASAYQDKASKDANFRKQVGTANDVLSRYKPENRPKVVKEAVSKEGRAAFQARQGKEERVWKNRIKRSAASQRAAERERYGKSRGWTSFTPSGHPKKGN